MKNYRLYLFELLFALLVIFAHTNFPSGELYFDSLGRVTVIFFFTLSSYFYTKRLNKDDFSYKSTIKRCFRLLLIAGAVIVIYCSILIPVNWSNLGTPKIITEGFNWNNFQEFWKFYIPKLSFLWFIIALIICYLLYPLVYKIKWFKENKYSIFIPVAILVSAYIYRIFCNHYDWGFFSIYQITRNFLITGLPCFLIGSYIYHHESQFKKINTLVFWLLFILLIGTSMLEAIYHEATSNKPNEFYLSSIVLAMLVLIYCIQKPDTKFGEFCYHYLGSTGPTFIYLFHMLFVPLVSSLYNINWGVLLIIFIADTCALLLGLIYNLFKVKVFKRGK